MLILTRKPGEWLDFDGGRIAVTVTSISGDQVRLGIVADKSIKVMRREVTNRDGEVLTPVEPEERERGAA